MNKHIFLLAFLFFFIQEGMSQSFRGGITLGFSATQVDGDKLGGYNRPTFKAGGLLEYKRRSRRKKGTFGLEINIQGKGSNTAIDVPVEAEQKIRLYYADFLPYYKYKFNKNFYVKGGVVISYLLKGDLKLGGFAFEMQEDKFDRISTDLNLGVGIKIQKNFFLQIEGQTSLLPFANIQKETNLFNSKGLRHSILTFGIVILFD
ncbi:MAG: PorT family protein [Flavobacteriales bacterium]|nr:PorT family protein [Flavobacteriales bacterium]